MWRAFSPPIGALILLCLTASARAQTTAPATAPACASVVDFRVSGRFHERICEYRFEPEVKIHINAPGEAAWDARRPVRVIVYALPNGNTTAQTIGRQVRPGDDWHFGIQHIGAQVRRLREVCRDENIVVAYVEAEGKSWPAWRSRRADAPKLIAQVVDSICGHFGPAQVWVTLAGHSGGGAFLLAYIDGCEHIPDRVSRIAFLDANYSYSDAQRHGDKLVEWLRAGPDHALSVIAYDDRNVVFSGKPIVSPTGGTWRRTEEMLARLEKDFEFNQATSGPAGSGDEYVRVRALGGRVDIILHRNPQNKILHTALVGDMSGFIHAMTCGAPCEGKAGTFKRPVTYGKWIE